MRIVITLMLIICGYVAFSQEKLVEEKLNKKLKEFPNYIEVKNVGILVSYKTVIVDGKVRNNITTISHSFIMYDYELNKMWENKRFIEEKIEINENNDDFNDNFYMASRLQNLVFSDTNKFIYFYKRSNSELIKIDANVGNVVSEVKIESAIDLAGARFDISSNYFYVIDYPSVLPFEEDEFNIDSSLIFRFDLKTMKYERYSFLQPQFNNHKKKYANNPKKTYSRVWKLLGVSDNKIYFSDSHRLIQESKSLKNILVYNFDTKKMDNEMLSIGEDVFELHNLKGEAVIDNKIYTWATTRKNLKGYMIISAYDENYYQIFQKIYQFPLEFISTPKTKVQPEIYKTDEGNIIFRAGHNEYSYIFETNEVNLFEFNTYDGKSCGNTDMCGYDCHQYINNFKEKKEIESYIRKSVRESKKRTKIQFFFTPNNKVIITRKSEPFFSIGIPQQYYKLVLFKL